MDRLIHAIRENGHSLGVIHVDPFGVPDPSLKAGAVETAEDAHDQRAGRPQASVAGVTLLPRRQLSGSRITGRQPGPPRRVPSVQSDVRDQAQLGEYLPSHPLRGRGGIGRGSVQEDLTIMRSVLVGGFPAIPAYHPKAVKNSGPQSPRSVKKIEDFWTRLLALRSEKIPA